MEMKDEFSQVLDFTTVPEYQTLSNQSLSYSNQPTGSMSVLVEPNKEKFSLQYKYFVNLDIPNIEDYRLNLLEINTDENYFLIGVKNKLTLLPFNFKRKNYFDKLGIGKAKTVFTCQDVINQIKLLKDTSTGGYYSLAVDNSGFLYSKKIKFNFNNSILEELEYKVYDCRILANDNSIWSIDALFPYILVGGNHKCVLVQSIEDVSPNENIPIKRNYLLSGNNHNVPYVTFSPCGEFIASSSIDSEVKIWDFATGKLVKKLPSKNKEWGWGVKFIHKNLFNLTTQVQNPLPEDINLGMNHNFLHHTQHSSNAEDFDLNLFEMSYLLNLDDTSLHHAASGTVPLDDQILKISDQHAQASITICESDDSFFTQKMRNNLLQYLILSTYKDYANLYVLYYKEKENTLSHINLGSIDLLHNYTKYKFAGMSVLSFNIMMMLKALTELSRYEFIFISNAVNAIIFGNRQGDIQFYELEIRIGNNRKAGINNRPLCIIEAPARIAGMRIEDHMDQVNMSNSYVEIYILTINGMLHSYKLKRI